MSAFPAELESNFLDPFVVLGVNFLKLIDVLMDFSVDVCFVTAELVMEISPG
jgi:hypothetical protein